MNNRRKLANILRVEQDFKKKQMLRVLALAATYVVISTIVLGFFYIRLLHPEMLSSRGFYYEITDSGALWRELPGLPSILLVWASSMTALSALFATSVGLHFTHKLAGPLYRFKSEFERLANGKAIRPIVLRAGDDFQDCAAAMNRALSHIAEQKQLPSADFEAVEELERHRETNRVLLEILDRFDSSAMGREDRAVAERLRTDLSELLAKVDSNGA